MKKLSDALAIHHLIHQAVLGLVHSGDPDMVALAGRLHAEIELPVKAWLADLRDGWDLAQALEEQS